MFISSTYSSVPYVKPVGFIGARNHVNFSVKILLIFGIDIQKFAEIAELHRARGGREI